eukprot:TRINITY_DN9510_c0_g1::TRINITY_DN9510_c0_g1_i1::g.198::m.198 TRINITY_DN9510_c0_g1::TRINITY_DN9510_c0_g1_i1::g.198  ORF type:complete len:213 (-),score=54.94,ACT_6/PF13740.1/3.5e-09,ACT_6/PF13740.1/0.04,ACT/PF01842.20/0.043,ACT/PF01842.20/5.5e-08,ACT_4/PF13291.1/1.9,ACT_4/PF13291.1/0.00011,Dynamitin/PF04912.9/0.039,Transketolase_C/PF02780.15/0.075 TRINITY_DN9510_c0_g1_i1:398-994(-)
MANIIRSARSVLTLNQQALRNYSVSTQKLVVVAHGPDRVGVISDLAACVKEYNGNIEKTKAGRLGGLFTCMSMLTIPKDKTAALHDKLRSTLNGFYVTLESTSDNQDLKNQIFYKLTLSAPDKPGIVREVTSECAKHGMNLEELETSTSTAPFAGYTTFEMNARVAVASNVSVQEINKRFNELEKTIGGIIKFDLAGK